MELKTPLYDCHVAAGGKIVPFAGYLLPVQYTGVIKEHMAVRTACGLFDVSHMGEFLIKGADALNNVQNLFCNDFENMYDGQVRYSPMCNERGGIVDDVLIYKVNGEEYLLTMHNSQNYSLINAHNSEVLRIMHKGIAGGWAVEDICGFVPEIICGIFIFCRYIEQENEFLVV